MRHLMLPFVALGVLAVAVSGCGGDDDASDTTTTEKPAVKESSTTIAEDTAVTGVPPECEDMLAAFQGISAPDALSSISDGSNPAPQYQRLADAMELARENAPEEIAGALDTMAESYQQLAGAADDVDWEGIANGDPAASAAATKLMEGFGSEELTEAGETLTTWLTENCMPPS